MEQGEKKLPKGAEAQGVLKLQKRTYTKKNGEVAETYSATKELNGVKYSFDLNPLVKKAKDNKGVEHDVMWCTVTRWKQREGGSI